MLMEPRGPKYDRRQPSTMKNYILAALPVLCVVLLVGYVASQPKVDEREVQYEHILRKRLEFQERIFAAINLYRETNQKAHEQREKLLEYLGNKPLSEAIELFKGKPDEIPQNLRTAYSCWQTLLRNEMLQLRIDGWLEKQQLSGILDQLDEQIGAIEERRQLGEIMNSEELAELDRLLAQHVAGWETSEIVDRAMLEEKAAEKIKNELTK